MSIMEKSRRSVVIALVLTIAGGSSGIVAQAPPSGKSLAATLNVYVFPSAGQAADQQSKDEGECYQWAVQNTGSDPFDLQKSAQQTQAQAQQQAAATKQATQGAGAKAAVGGAAAGALIGEIASDDAGEGAAIGAAAGLIAGRRRAKAAQGKADAQAQQQVGQSKQTTAEAMGNFKKAFSVCLESKKYMVKF